MNELTIRRAGKRDIDAIAGLEKICFAIPWSRKSIAHELTENKIALYIVAEINGQVVGYGGMWHIIDEAHITNVAVMPEYRRKHIASAIITVMIEASVSKGIHRFTLEVRSGNQAARALYSRFGFKEAGLRKGYYEDNGEDAVIMWRDPEEPLKN